MIDMLISLWQSTGFAQGGWQNYVMIPIACFLLYLAIGRGFEPLLLVPISFGMLLVNIPGGYEVLYGIKTEEWVPSVVNILDEAGNIIGQEVVPVLQTGIKDPGLFYYLYFGVEHVIYPPLIFLGIGAMTDFGPLIANPKSMLMGAGAQLGIFIAFIVALMLGFSDKAAAAISIIGGADGPTAIYLTNKLGNPDDLLPVIAIAAYSYMALIPFIQRPIMKLLTTKKERSIRMEQLRPVSKKEKIIFPIMVSIVVSILLPAALPLVGCLMLGNLLKECAVTDRLAKTASNDMLNIITIVLGLCVGSKAVGPVFLNPMTLMVIGLGLFAFAFGTVGGLLVAKVMNAASNGKINPLIGSAGVSAVPMAARVSQNVGREDVPDNYLLMHAMGPNVAGVIGSAVAAAMLLSFFG